MKPLLAPLLAAAALLAGCGTTTDTRTPALAAYAQARAATQVAPAANVTPFNAALHCMAGQLRQHQVELALVVEDMPDKTGKVAGSASDMFLTAMSQVSHNSGALVRTQAWGSELRNLIELSRLAGRTAVQPASLPDVAVRGAVTQFDDNLARHTVDAGASLGPLGKWFGGLGLARSTSVNLVAIDLQLVDARSFSLVPGAAAHNVAAIVQDGQGSDAEVSYYARLGGNFGRSQARTDGKTVALRSLVELSTVELLGRYARLPYWRCLGARDDHPDVLREVDAWFDAMGTTDKMRWLRRELAAMGLLPLRGELEPTLFRLAFRAYAKALDAPIDTISRQLWRAHFKADLAVVAQKAMRSFEAARAATPLVSLSAGPRAEQLADLSLSLSVPGHVSCLYQPRPGLPFMLLAPATTFATAPLPKDQALGMRELFRLGTQRVQPGDKWVACLAFGRDRRQELANAWERLSRTADAADPAVVQQLREAMEAKGDYVTMAAATMAPTDGRKAAGAAR